MPCALFLATKTDNYYVSLRSFTEKIPNVTTEDVIAPEFLLTQGLRFTFDVRHPFRGLEGGILELNALAHGEGTPGPHQQGQTSAGLVNALRSLPPPPSASESGAKPMSLTTRIAKAHHGTREILKSAAQLTDAYFLYTPSQIWLAAFLITDKPLAELYLDIKLGPSTSQPPTLSSTSPPDMLRILRHKLNKVLSSCADLLQTYLSTHTPDSGGGTMKNLKRIGKKLYHCQNPEKIDLVSLNRAQKREGSSASASASGNNTSVPDSGGPTTAPGAAPGLSEEAELERVAKKRKLEREKFKKEGAAMFGGELVRERKKEAGNEKPDEMG